MYPNLISNLGNSQTEIEFLTSEHPNFELYKLHGDSLIEKYNLFLADGEKTVKRLLESSFQVKEIIGLEKYFDKEFLKLLALHPEIEKVYIGSTKTLKEIRGYDLHQGIMALAQIPNLTTKPQGSIFIGTNILEANNWGSLIRSLCALGIKNLVFDSSSCHPFIRRSVRVSMGTIFQMQIHQTKRVSIFLREYFEAGYKIYGTGIPKSNKKLLSFSEWNPPPKCIVILGNEDSGISQNLEEWIHEYVWIPIEKTVDSLNVAVAGAILATKLRFHNYSQS